MRILLDQGIGRQAARILRSSGIDTVHVGEIGMFRAADDEILALARREQRVIVTLDADFHLLLAITGASMPSVVRIRREGLDGPAVAGLLLDVAGPFADRLKAGAVMTITQTGVRLRRLPIGPE